MSLRREVSWVVCCDEPNCVRTIAGHTEAGVKLAATACGWERYGAASRIRYRCPDCKRRYVA